MTAVPRSANIIVHSEEELERVRAIIENHEPASPQVKENLERLAKLLQQ